VRASVMAARPLRCCRESRRMDRRSLHLRHPRLPGTFSHLQLSWPSQPSPALWPASRQHGGTARARLAAFQKPRCSWGEMSDSAAVEAGVEAGMADRPVADPVASQSRSQSRSHRQARADLLSTRPGFPSPSIVSAEGLAVCCSIWCVSGPCANAARAPRVAVCIPP